MSRKWSQRVIRLCKESCLKLKTPSKPTRTTTKKANKWADIVDQQTATAILLLEKFPIASHIQPPSSCGRASCASRCSAQLLIRTNRHLQVILQLNKVMVIQPSACHVGGGLCNRRLGENILLIVTEIQVSQAVTTLGFWAWGVSSVELELRELISNPDDPPIYLRGSFRSLAQTGTWYTHQEHPQDFSVPLRASDIRQTHTQQPQTKIPAGHGIREDNTYIPVFCLLFKAYHAYNSFQFLKTIYRLSCLQNLHGLTNPYSHHLKLYASF